MIQIRDVPEHIYRRLIEDARTQRRSLSQQAVATLAKGLEAELDPKARRKKLLQEIHTGDPAPYAGLPDPAKSIREDRTR